MLLLPRSLRDSAFALLASSALLRSVAAQVTTECQPLNRTGCPADAALGMAHQFVFNSTPSADAWETTAGSVDYTDQGAVFVIKKQKDSPTIRSKFYIFFGRVEIMMKAAPGTGIISSMMMLSDDLDEIDWEFMGGNTTHAETNYFGKGRQDFKNAVYYPVKGGVQADYHNYTTVWTNTSLDYYIDGAKVRTLLPKEANNTNNYPQTPMRISLGIWAGGDSSMPEGTRQWAGGDTDYDKSPFTMYVKSAQITDFSSGKEYSYSDQSGSWPSIKIAEGNSTIKDAILAPPSPTLAERWNSLSPTAKIAIYASAAAVVAAFLGFMVFYFIKQRRRGARDAKLAEERALQERLELEQFKKAGIDPDSFTDHGSEYNFKGMREDGLIRQDSYSVPNIEKGWESASLTGAGAAAAGMRSPVPLLREGAQTPRTASPGPAYFGNGAGYGRDLSPQDRLRSPAPLVSPVRSPSPGMPPNFPLPASPANRSLSTPTSQMRTNSPGPQMGGYAGMPRTQSPAPMGGPQRSFTASGYGGGHGEGQSGHGGSGGHGYWR